ncbi:DUF397 domain-containing protein [Actinomadura hibisca]|uniref:DUF397 domain-containing protein n=1 Tax=Actinomadura hibisca TaxID=68565 RepID=UPI000A0075E7|nr:DUF397 domain-containing protein [Actinomadura hibisca]
MPQSELSRARWRKSSHSNENGSCVELADLTRSIGVRDSTDPGGPSLRLQRTTWADLCKSIRVGALDLSK